MEENHESTQNSSNESNVQSNSPDLSKNEGCQKTIISVLIWMGSPFVGLVLIPLATQVKPGGLGYFFNFMGMDLAIMLTFFLIDFRAGMREIGYLLKSLFNFILRRKSKEVHEVKDETLDPKYGRSAIWISAIIFALGGFLSAIGSDATFSDAMTRYEIFGAVWGGVVYFLIQKKIFVLESFMGDEI